MQQREIYFAFSVGMNAALQGNCATSVRKKKTGELIKGLGRIEWIYQLH
jgi:hypothetical protein